MRKLLILLTPLLLAGCIKQSASYYIDGNHHAVTVRAEQAYFWKEEVTLKLVATRWPDCVRTFTLANVAPTDLAVELFGSGDNAYTVRAGDQVWQVETQTCSQLERPADTEFGEALGVFRLGEKDMVFEEFGATALSDESRPELGAN
jgi:hypothetical protein